MSKISEWDQLEFTEQEFEKLAKDLKYQRYFSRWPVVDPEMKHEPIAELFHSAWTQYSKILDNGKGLDTILTIQRQINSEIEEAQQNLDDFPDDADSVYKYRLKRSLSLLNIRKTTLKKLITAYSVHGEIESAPDFELDNIESLALNIVCKGQRVSYKREALEEYLKIRDAEPAKNSTMDIFKKLEESYDDLSYSSFAGWVSKLNDELERIKLSQI